MYIHVYVYMHTHTLNIVIIIAANDHQGAHRALPRDRRGRQRLCNA